MSHDPVKYVKETVSCVGYACESVRKMNFAPLSNHEMTALDQRAFGRESLRPAPHYMKKVPPIVIYQQSQMEQGSLGHESSHDWRTMRRKNPKIASQVDQS